MTLTLYLCTSCYIIFLKNCPLGAVRIEGVRKRGLTRILVGSRPWSQATVWGKLRIKLYLFYAHSPGFSKIICTYTHLFLDGPIWPLGYATECILRRYISFHKYCMVSVHDFKIWYVYIIRHNLSRSYIKILFNFTNFLET